MRQALAGTTISRDYLDTLLNSLSDGGAGRGAGRAGCARSTRPLRSCSASSAIPLAGVAFESLVAEPHRRDLRARARC